MLAIIHISRGSHLPELSQWCHNVASVIVALSCFLHEWQYYTHRQDIVAITLPNKLTNQKRNHNGNANIRILCMQIKVTLICSCATCFQYTLAYEEA